MLGFKWYRKHKNTVSPNDEYFCHIESLPSDNFQGKNAVTDLHVDIIMCELNLRIRICK